MKKNMFWYCSVTLMLMVTGITQVWALTADFNATSPTSGDWPLTVVFQDASTDATSWSWDFGDGGTSTEQNPTYTYNDNAGIFTVTLTVGDGVNSDTLIKTNYIEVFTKADFNTSRSTTNGPGPLSVNFRDRSSDDVTTWSWDFGDGGTSTDDRPTHVYTTPGIYNVSLTVNGYGTDTETKVAYITVLTGVNITSSLASGKSPLTVNFTSDGTSDVTSWFWDFGNGETSTDQNPGNVEYENPGIYTVTLTGNGSEAEDTKTITVVDPWVKNVTNLASASPQECWTDVGERVDPLNLDPFECPDGAMEYTPLTYTWSLTHYKSGENNDSVWFGTGANVLCTTQGAFISDVNAGGYGSNICEYDQSPIFEERPNIPPQYGDWRPPKIFRYDRITGQLIDRTPYGDPKINQCLGLRMAGSHRQAGQTNGVVFFAGGTFNQGVVMFAYNADTGVYLGSQYFPQWRTARKGDVIDGHFYFGVGSRFNFNDPISYIYNGRIVRWTGSVDNPFSFVEVGRVNGAVRELVEYIDGNGDSRIAVTAKGVNLSDPIPDGGLPEPPFAWSSWTSIWDANMYEPDSVTADSYIGGGIGYLNGWLYFGTMHIPGNAADMHSTCTYGLANLDSNDCAFDPDAGFTNDERNAISNSTERATSIWRIKNAELSPGPGGRVTQLLYGESQLPAYVGDDNWDPLASPYDAFPMVDTGWEPMLGSSGFNSYCNNYSWVMEVVDNHLFVGTMDYCTLFDPSGGYYDDPADPYGISTLGADLWRIDGTASDTPVAAVPDTTRAFGGPGIYTYRPYGFRTLIKAVDGTNLMFAGMASGVNLGAVGDGAGFQLLELDPTPPPPPLTCAWDVEPVGSPDFDVDGLDLNAAAAMAPSPVDLEALASQFGTSSCME